MPVNFRNQLMERVSPLLLRKHKKQNNLPQLGALVSTQLVPKDHLWRRDSRRGSRIRLGRFRCSRCFSRRFTV